VNDPFVMKAWGDSLKANNITLVADWDGSFTKLVDKELDLSAAGLGKRCKRYSLLVDNGKIVKENVEVAPNEYAPPPSPPPPLQEPRVVPSRL
jgi:peroxiredoxin